MVEIKKRKQVFVLIVCLALGFTLRYHEFDKKSLWTDEVYTFNDSRDDFRGQLKWYKENPSFLHPPLFFILTHQFYPFEKPERDLRIVPLIFGTLSIPMIYVLANSFSPPIALPCAISLTFMAYHISLSQEGRSYSLLMFIGMAGLYFFMQHLNTSKKRYLIGVALCFAILFHTSYSSIPFIILSQILWLYRPKEDHRKSALPSFLTLNSLVLFLCLPWITFLALNYRGQSLAPPLHTEDPGSFGYILYGVLHDWVPHLPLTIASVIAFVLFPVFSKHRRNTFVLLGVCILPIVGLYLYCRVLNVRHFITSRYFINLLPFFLTCLYLSLDGLEFRFQKLRGFLRFKLLFLILFIASNVLILPLYYRSEKQDFRGLATYLNGKVRDGDKIILGTTGYFAGLLHYLGVYPSSRHYIIPYRKVSEQELEYRVSLSNENGKFDISYSKNYWIQYALEGNRMWIVVDKPTAKQVMNRYPCVLMGYFDGSFLNYDRFPYDASIYLCSWDPKSPGEKGIDMDIE